MISNYIAQNIVVCNYLSLPEIPASGAKVLIYCEMQLLIHISLIYNELYDVTMGGLHCGYVCVELVPEAGIAGSDQ